MNGLLGNLIFLNPWILTALAALPALWFLLRITPPAPKLIILPTTRFLEGLISDTQTPSKTPWWILLLRLIVAALVILALARPVYNPANNLPVDGAVRLVIDNGWAAAQSWDQQTETALEVLAQAEREKREVYIQTTAPVAGQEAPAAFGPLAAAQASPVLKGLKPLPWPAAYKEAAAQVQTHKPARGNIYSLWLSHGLYEQDIQTLINALQSQGGLSIVTPAPESLPLVLKPPKDPGYALEIAVDGPEAIPAARPAGVMAMNTEGRVIDQQNITLDPGAMPQTVTFDIPETLRHEISQYRLNGQQGAGGVFLLDERFRKRAVGIAGPEDEADIKPFIEAHYYLRRALEPYTTLYQAPVDELLGEAPSVIILPDIAAMPVSTLNALEDWVQDGGLLLRFAGPNMAQSQSETVLVPVPLRKGGRALDGSMTWEKPVALSAFPKESPLHGIVLHEDILVRRQILAVPADDLERRTWATMEDGTPLITAAPLGKGLLVMVHTTASPEWSDLPLSGAFVEILRRIINISGGVKNMHALSSGFLQPQIVLDGFGNMQTPDSAARAIDAALLPETVPGPLHPPGIYGNGSFQVTLNLGEHIRTLRAVGDMPASVHQRHYGQSYERDLLAPLLLSATILLLLDWLIMIVLAAGLRPLARFAGLAFILAATPAMAQDDITAMKYADGFYLAYIQTGNPGVDATTHKGLENLVKVLQRRTSVEPAGVAGINPERDEMAFFPLVYWAVTGHEQSVSPQAIANIQHYLDHGGTILFDTRDHNHAAGSLTGTKNQQALRAMTSALNIPPLEPIREDHVLTKSFYLLDSFPGQYEDGTLWVETNSASGRDNVSSVIIGANDWASIWASGNISRSSFGGGSRQQEMSYRFGVNLVMYALTGNYKADQVHVPFILERLGQ